MSCPRPFPQGEGARGTSQLPGGPAWLSPRTEAACSDPQVSETKSTSRHASQAGDMGLLHGPRGHPGLFRTLTPAGPC